VKIPSNQTQKKDIGSERGMVLIVDDNEDNRIVLARRLERQGLSVAAAENGREAIELLKKGLFDLMLLDIMMPEMNGYQVLEYLKTDPELGEIPVIVISAVDELESIVRCIELGAEDYLTKPFNRVMLRARIGATLEKKRLRDQEKEFTKLLQIEQDRSERLLLSIFPASIAERLKQEQTIADSYMDVSILFADIVDFTRHSAKLSPTETIEFLSSVFSEFDQLTERHGLEKIKTVADAYMVVGGLPRPMEHHAEAIANLGLDMMQIIRRFKKENEEPFTIRVGIHCGPVVAGVIGTHKFIYDLWGDTVNVASRMESHGVPGKIQTTERLFDRLRDKYKFEKRGPVHVKGKGEMDTYFLLGKKGTGK
jgi:class 3 adenylate cyclase